MLTIVLSYCNFAVTNEDGECCDVNLMDGVSDEMGLRRPTVWSKI